MSVRTVHLRLSPNPVDGPNAWPVIIERAVFLGDLIQVHLDWGGQKLVLRQTALSPIPAEGPGYLSVDPARCVLLER